MNTEAANLFSASLTRSKQLKIALFAIVIGLVVLGFSIGGVLSHTSNATEVKGVSQVEKNNGTIDIPGFEKLSFKAGLKKQSVNFFNPKENSCYFQMTLLTEDGNILWKSEVIEPGESINELQLNKELGQGSFPAILRYDCFSLEDKSALNGAEVKITIDVL